MLMSSLPLWIPLGTSRWQCLTHLSLVPPKGQRSWGFHIPTPILGQRLSPGLSTPRHLYFVLHVGWAQRKPDGREFQELVRGSHQSSWNNVCQEEISDYYKHPHTLCDKVTSAPCGTKTPRHTLWRIVLENSKIWWHQSRDAFSC